MSASQLVPVVATTAHALGLILTLAASLLWVVNAAVTWHRVGLHASGIVYNRWLAAAAFGAAVVFAATPFL